MNSRRHGETRWLVPALALHHVDSVDAADDGLDALFERREVCALRQPLKRISEVNIGVLECHLGEHLGQGTPAKPLGAI